MKGAKKTPNLVMSNYHRAVVKYLTSSQCLLDAEQEDYLIQMLSFSLLLMGKA